MVAKSREKQKTPSQGSSFLEPYLETGMGSRKAAVPWLGAFCSLIIMKTFGAYLLGFLAAILLINWGSYFGFIGLGVGLIVGVIVANKIIEKITGKKAKQYRLFTEKK